VTFRRLSARTSILPIHRLLLRNPCIITMDETNSTAGDRSHSPSVASTTATFERGFEVVLRLVRHEGGPMKVRGETCASTSTVLMFRPKTRLMGEKSEGGGFDGKRAIVIDVPGDDILDAILGERYEELIHEDRWAFHTREEVERILEAAEKQLAANAETRKDLERREREVDAEHDTLKMLKDEAKYLKNEAKELHEREVKMSGKLLQELRDAQKERLELAEDRRALDKKIAIVEADGRSYERLRAEYLADSDDVEKQTLALEDRKREFERQKAEFERQKAEWLAEKDGEYTLRLAIEPKY
jgi:hypothetical protein